MKHRENAKEVIRDQEVKKQNQKQQFNQVKSDAPNIIIHS